MSKKKPKQELTLDEWLDEANRIRDAHPDPFYYCSNVRGTPKYDNGFDFLYEQGLSPQEALDKWRTDD